LHNLSRDEIFELNSKRYTTATKIKSAIRSILKLEEENKTKTTKQEQQSPPPVFKQKTLDWNDSSSSDNE